MTTEQDLARAYRVAAINHYQNTTIENRSAQTQESADKLLRASVELLRSPTGSSELKRLLGDVDPRVRLAAACDLLPRGSWRARFVLKLLSAFRRDALGLIAQARLHVWKNEHR